MREMSESHSSAMISKGPILVLHALFERRIVRESFEMPTSLCDVDVKEDRIPPETDTFGAEHLANGDLALIELEAHTKKMKLSKMITFDIAGKRWFKSRF